MDEHKWTVVAFLSLVTIQVTVGIVYKSAGSGSAYQFSPSLSLFLSETLKMCMAIGALVLFQDHWKAVVLRHTNNAPLLMKTFGLASLYALNNLLAFELFLVCDPATMSITKSSSSLVVAALSYVVFGKLCSVPQWIALLLQVVGLSIVHLNAGGKGSATSHTSSLLMYVLLGLQISISGLTGVWNSHLLKPEEVTLNAFNLNLYAFGAVLNLTAYWLWEGAQHSILEGWSVASVGILLCNSLIGLAISAIYKYADALVRTWATAIATTVLYLVVIGFGWATFPIAPILQGILVVFASAYLYNRMTPAVQEAPTERRGSWTAEIAMRLGKVVAVVALCCLLFFSAVRLEDFRQGKLVALKNGTRA